MIKQEEEEKINTNKIREGKRLRRKKERKIIKRKNGIWS